MKLFIVDTFTSQIFGGNQAGVVLLGENQDFLEPQLMRSIAAELKHSETAFVKTLGDREYQIRYFTPEAEVDLCGHATIALFTVLRNEGLTGVGNCIAHTKAGALQITVDQDRIWMQMAQGKFTKYLSDEEAAEIYSAYGLTLDDIPEGLAPCIAGTGLPDILLPVVSKEKLFAAVQNRDEVVRISRRHDIVGVHMFCLDPAPGVTAACRNFAPVVGINEESATGTANGALTYYLYTASVVRENAENVFVQGESMGRPSEIRSRVVDGSVLIGGNAVVSVEGWMRV